MSLFGFECFIVWLTQSYKGYDMSPMAEGIHDEAVIEVVPPEQVLSDTAIVKVCGILALGKLFDYCFTVS